MVLIIFERFFNRLTGSRFIIDYFQVFDNKEYPYYLLFVNNRFRINFRPVYYYKVKGLN